jgi:long-chain acyl-CoA synthetase
VNVAQNVERARRLLPRNEAILFEGRRVTYEELDRSVNRVANVLRALGVERGDRVALLLPNTPEFAYSYLAVQKIGAVAVSLNVMLTKREVRFMLEDSAPRVTITTEALREVIEEQALEHPLTVLIAEGEAPDEVRLAALVDRASSAFDALDMRPEEPAAILYTSGTTGFPKGATLSHGNVVSNVFATQHYTAMTPSDRLQLFLPLFHCFGQNFIMNSAFGACATIVMQRRFTLEDALAAIDEHDVSMFFAVPAVFIQILNAGVSPASLAPTRYHFSAAAALPAEVAANWHERYGKKIYEGYGLTETSPFSSYNHDLRHKLGSIGEPIENVEMRVVDEQQAEVEPGEWGEIVIRGPNVMLGYWNRPEETAEAVRDGWFHSGDIGAIDEEGYFSICDRLKDMIITSGFNVYPAEVENILYAHPAVAEAAVYGSPDEVRGEVVHANLILHDPSSTTSEELSEFCRERLAAYKVPRHYDFVEEIPKSATGKVLKRVLRGEEVSPG